MINLQELQKILSKWLQLNISHKVYLEFLDLSGLLIARSGDRMIDLQKEKITFADVHRCASVLKGVRCHEQTCERNNCSTSHSPGMSRVGPLSNSSDRHTAEGETKNVIALRSYHSLAF